MCVSLAGYHSGGHAHEAKSSGHAMYPVVLGYQYPPYIQYMFGSAMERKRAWAKPKCLTRAERHWSIDCGVGSQSSHPG
jgi:hypothetical protein